MARVEGLPKLMAQLTKLGQDKLKEAQEASVIVGYTAAYAIYVHENLEAKHPVGQAKFLEQPAKMMQKEIAKVVTNALKQKMSMYQALLLGGLFLQRESQLLCPVNTGALRASAHTRKG